MHLITYIGIDNGVGTVGLITNVYTEAGKFIRQEADILPVPIRKELDYTKKKQMVSRLDIKAMRQLLKGFKPENTFVALERPMVNPGRFKASAVGLRIYEAMLIALEDTGHRRLVIDSKAWQKEILPSGIKGSDKLKKASAQIGKQLFPHLEKKIKRDADGLLIAYWLSNKGEL